MNVCARRAQRPTNLFDRTMPSRRQTSVENERLCLEGTTERSDSNRVRSARISANCTMCLEGTTPQDRLLKHFHRRTAFQAESLQLPLPRTSSPVIVASLRSAFQALNTKIKRRVKSCMRAAESWCCEAENCFLLLSRQFPAIAGQLPHNCGAPSPQLW